MIILAPAVREFGEDKGIDALIRKYGYRGTPATLAAVDANADLAAELGAAAHLIHASSEGRFRITWCPGHLTRDEIEGVGFEYGDLATMMQRYDPAKLKHGYNTVDGEEIFFIANPGLGLWAHASRLENEAGAGEGGLVGRTFGFEISIKMRTDSGRVFRPRLGYECIV